MPIVHASRFSAKLLALSVLLASPGRAEDPLRGFEGVVEPAKQWNVSSPVDGFIEGINFTEGQLVAEGDVLVEFATLVAELNLELAKATHERASAAWEESEADLSRQRELREREAISISAYSDYELSRELAKINLRTADVNPENAPVFD